MKLILGIVISIVLGMAFLNIFADPLDDVVSAVATDVETVTTGVAETTGSVTLATQHFFSSVLNLTVSCVTDAAPGFTLAADRVTVNLSGLTASTVQVCTTTFQTEGTGDFEAIVELVPLFMVIAVLGIALGGAAVGVGAAGFGPSKLQGIGAGISVGGFVVALLSVILLPVINGFVGDSNAIYSIRPEYTGVDALIDLVTVGYAISILTFMIGGGIGAARRGLG